MCMYNHSLEVCSSFTHLCVGVSPDVRGRYITYQSVVGSLSEALNAHPVGSYHSSINTIAITI